MIRSCLDSSNPTYSTLPDTCRIPFCMRLGSDRHWRRHAENAGKSESLEAASRASNDDVRRILRRLSNMGYEEEINYLDEIDASSLRDHPLLNLPKDLTDRRTYALMCHVMLLNKLCHSVDEHETYSNRAHGGNTSEIDKEEAQGTIQETPPCPDHTFLGVH